jgi:hypothetical protein
METFAVSLADGGNDIEIFASGVRAWSSGFLNRRAMAGEFVAIIVTASGVAEATGIHTIGVTSETVDIFLWDEYMETTFEVMNGQGVPMGGPPIWLAFIFEMPAHDVTDLRITHTFSPPAVLGDANRDGRVTSLDAVYIARHVIGDTVDICQTSADANGDGIINIADVTLLLRRLVGLE